MMQTTRSTPADAGTSAPSKWIVLAVAGAGTYMSTLSAGMVNVALPTITDEFNAPIVITQWVVLAYLVSVTGLLLPMGRLADMVGRKRIFLLGFLIFAGGAAVCGVAPALGALIVGRLIQGAGGAMLQSNSSGLVTQAFPATERGRALGLNAAIVSAGHLSGPVIGGLIIDWLGWHWLFLVSVPIALVAAAIGWRRLPAIAGQPDQKFDLAGAVLFLAFITGLLLTLNQGGQAGWLAPSVLGLAAGTSAAAVLFVLAERRAPQPILDTNLFRNAGVRVAIVSGFLVFVSMSQNQLLMPFYLQVVLGLTAAQAGLVLVTQPGMLMVLAPITGSLSDRFGSRILASLGAAIAAGGLLSLATLTAESDPIAVVGRMMVLALGMALFSSPNTSALFGSLPRDRYGVAGAYQSLTRNLGQSIGQTMAALLWTTAIVTTSGLPPADATPDAQMAGFRAVWLIAAALVATAAVLSLVARPPDRSGARRATR
jgi:EmrB/QacA subfamily drug resistance transporter